MLLCPENDSEGNMLLLSKGKVFASLSEGFEGNWDFI